MMIFCVILLTSLVMAHDGGPLDINADDIIGTDLPNFARTLFGNQRINLHLELEDGDNEIHGLVTQNGVITEFTDSEVSNPTLNVYSTQSVITRILTSDDAGSDFSNALDNGEISYEAIGFVNRVRFGFASVFLNIARWFGSDQEHDKVLNDDLPDESGSTLTGSNVAEIVTDDTTDTTTDTTADTTADTTTDTTADTTADTTTDITTDTTTDTTTDSYNSDDIVKQVKEESIGETLEDTITDDVHVVKLVNDGFSPKKLTIKNGDKVIWENERTGSFSKSMIIGVRSCRDVKSKVLNSGDSYEHTFTLDGSCVIVDGMMTTVESKIIVR
jgi:plastocyanin